MVSVMFRLHLKKPIRSSIYREESYEKITKTPETCATCGAVLESNTSINTLKKEYNNTLPIYKERIT